MQQPSYGLHAEGPAQSADVSLTAAGFGALHSFAQLPTARETVLQLCDVQDAELAALLADGGSAAPAAAKCTEANGFFAYSMLQQIQVRRSGGRRGWA